MDKLPFAPPHRAGEPPTAYASRIAAAYGLEAKYICSDHGIRYLDLVNGAEYAIKKLATLGGADVAELSRAAFVRTGINGFTHRGQIVRSEYLVTDRLDICPHCLVEDMEGAGGDAATAFFCRAAWMVNVVDTCPTHGTALVTVLRAKGLALRFDFSSALTALPDHLPELAGAAERRTPSPLQDYVLARLDGRQTDIPLLDAMDLSAAVRSCELLGAAACFGGNAKRRDLDAAQLASARTTGFHIALQGRQAIHDLLKKLADAYALRRPDIHNQAARKAFAELHGFLRVDPARPTWKDDTFGPLRAVVTDFIKTNIPLAPGEEALGERIETRMLHSVSSLAKDLRIGVLRTRKLLVLAGTIAPDAPANVVFDAAAGVEATRECRSNLSYYGVVKHLGITRHLAQRLVGARLIVPTTASALGLRPVFQPDMLDAFVARLGQRARPVKRKSPTQVTIGEASRRTTCREIDTVLAILDGRLSWVGRLAGQDGYRSILVDLSEVEIVAHGLGSDTISIPEFAKRSGIDKEAIRLLAVHGFLGTDPGRRGGLDVRRIPSKEIEAFNRRFVTLGELSRTRRIHHTPLKKSLAAKGVLPVIEPGKVMIVLYRRDAVDAAR